MINGELTQLLKDTLIEKQLSPKKSIGFTESTNSKFGDYQTNAAMVLSKEANVPSRDLAASICQILGEKTNDFTFNIAGSGFINAKIKTEKLWKTLCLYLGDDKLGATPSKDKDTIVVDYSHPNLAKEMHVGHLRSTIIGDAIVKVLEFLDYNVIRHNHMGDWGTQFGMLIAHLSEQGVQSNDKALSDLEDFYRSAKKRFDEDKDFAELSRNYTVKLQNDAPSCHELWKRFIAISISHCDRVYKKLDVSLRPEHVYPESAYRDDLPVVISDLEKQSLVVESDGAKCVFLDEFKNDEGDHIPVIVQKKDGGYLYSTTDLAAIRYRAGKLGAKRILYVVDARQSLHLQQVFAVARTAQFLPDNVSLEHLSFGTMMGKDGKPFKTRAGTTVKLMDLLLEAETRAKSIVLNKSSDFTDDEVAKLSHSLGIGSVKYADLSKNRTNDYIFDLDAMLSFEGNTAPYLLYAHTRITSIFKKSNMTADTINEPSSYVPREPEERILILALTRFSETIMSVSANGNPNLLCSYLFNLSKTFMSFYEKCPVLSETESVRMARLFLCKGTATTINTGLSLLGISTVERM